MSILETTPAASVEDVRQFFEAFSCENTEQHGKAQKLLNYRVSLLKKHAQFKYNDDVLDIGCGNGHHLFALDGYIRSGIGIDIAAGMVDTANRITPKKNESSFKFLIDDAHSLSLIADNSVDVVFCVGALEHMVDKFAVLTNIRRVLRNKGRFVCLTLNDEFLWYRTIAPALGYATQHLATDQRLDYDEASRLLQAAGFNNINLDFWTFIPKGDMPPICAGLCRAVDLAGRLGMAKQFRSGLVLCGTK